jgi:type VI secretion system secreted protein Hcp
MAHEFYVTIKAKTQGELKGESPRQSHENKIPGIGYRHEIKAPVDVNTGAPSGHVQHGMIVFTKQWGAASPQLFQALTTREALDSVLFEFYHTTPEGQEEVYHTIELTDAFVTAIKYRTGGDAESSASSKTTAEYDTLELEDVALSYRRITAESKVGQTTAVHDWTNQ